MKHRTTAVAQRASTEGIGQEEAVPNVVQQLMFNRILTFLRDLSCEQVTLAGFDAKTGTIEGSLAGVNFVVNVGLAEKGPQCGAVS